MHKYSCFYKGLLTILTLLLCRLSSSLARRGDGTTLPHGTCVECGVLRPDQFYNLEKRVDSNELPWMARLVYNNSDIKYGCHGVLINDRYVLVPAHCIGATPLAAVELGCNGLRDTCAATHETNLYLAHPRYDGDTFDFNIGMIRLKEAVLFSDRIRPICLPDAEDRNQKYVGRHLPLTGWAFESREKSKKFVLVMDQRYCRKHIPREIMRDLGICANTCDNGSKFVAGTALMDIKVLDGEPHHYYLIGLLIFGPVDCTNFEPDHFQRIDPVLDWIVSVVKSSPPEEDEEEDDS